MKASWHTNNPGKRTNWFQTLPGTCCLYQEEPDGEGYDQKRFDKLAELDVRQQYINGIHLTSCTIHGLKPAFQKFTAGIYCRKQLIERAGINNAGSFYRSQMYI